MKRLIPYLTLIVTLMPTAFLCQSASTPSFQTVSFKDLSDTSSLKKELSQFTKNSIKSSSATIEKDILKEIPVWSCSDTTISFLKANFLVQSLNVYIIVSGKRPKTYIKNFYVSYSDHHHIGIPQIAYSDIYEPHTCDIPVTKKNKVIQSSKCKVFKRADRQRIYIYMLIGEGQNEQEVTWIIQNGKYLMRVIDKTP
jgi:cytochrome c-type biogenesis protein CcmH/NrfF